MARTDFTSELDGALSSRNLGSRHFSEIARSGNGDMTKDLSEEGLADYQELDGLGEGLEDLAADESAAVDQFGVAARLPRFRNLNPGETPPFAPKPGMTWLRKRILTRDRRPGGPRVARAKWVQVSSQRLAQLKQQGDIKGLGALSTPVMWGISAGAGLALGLVAWLLIRNRA
jgi:hypothetical protein